MCGDIAARRVKKLKDRRGVATRPDKAARHYRAALDLARTLSGWCTTSVEMP